MQKINIERCCSITKIEQFITDLESMLDDHPDLDLEYDVTKDGVREILWMVNEQRDDLDLVKIVVNGDEMLITVNMVEIPTNIMELLLAL